MIKKYCSILSSWIIKNCIIAFILLFSAHVYLYAHKVKISNHSKQVLPVRCIAKHGGQKQISIKPQACHIFESDKIHNIYLEGTPSTILDFHEDNVKEVNFIVAADRYRGKWDINKKYKKIPGKNKLSKNKPISHYINNTIITNTRNINIEEPYTVLGQGQFDPSYPKFYSY